MLNVFITGAVTYLSGYRVYIYMPTKPKSKPKSKPKIPATGFKLGVRGRDGMVYPEKYGQAPFLAYMNVQDQKRAKAFAASFAQYVHGASDEFPNRNAFQRFQHKIRAKYPKLLQHDMQNMIDFQQAQIKYDMNMYQKHLHGQQKMIQKIRQKMKTKSFDQARFLSANPRTRLTMLGLKIDHFYLDHPNILLV